MSYLRGRGKVDVASIARPACPGRTGRHASGAKRTRYSTDVDGTWQLDCGLLPAPRVLLLAKPGCHLCDVVRDIVGQVCGERGESWDERSILDDIELEQAYWEYIPVVFVDGQEIARWRLTAEDLHAALDRPASAASATDGSAGSPS